MELKPCPFCGGEPTLQEQMNCNLIIMCRICEARTRLGYPGETNARWNHRPIEDNLQSMLSQVDAARMREMDDASALRAELAAERARLEWCLSFLVEPGKTLEGDGYGPYQISAFVNYGSELECFKTIPTGQTARDVIDRLIGEADK